MTFWKGLTKIYKSTIVSLIISSPIIFNANLRVSLVKVFIADFNLFSCEADNFTFTVLY